MQYMLVSHFQNLAFQSHLVTDMNKHKSHKFHGQKLDNGSGDDDEDEVEDEDDDKDNDEKSTDGKLRPTIQKSKSKTSKLPQTTTTSSKSASKSTSKGSSGLKGAAKNASQLADESTVLGLTKVASDAVDAIKHWTGFGAADDAADELAQKKKDEEDGYWGLRDLCANTTWRPGFWLHCHNSAGPDHTSVIGGLNNARNRISVCVRMAIDAGLSLILPTVSVRSEAELFRLSQGSVCGRDLFNEEHLIEVLGEHCPEMEIRTCDDHSHIGAFLEAESRSHFDWAHSKPLPNIPGTFDELINRSLSWRGDLNDFGRDYQVSFGFMDAFNGWNYSASNETLTLRKAMFKALEFNADVLEIGARVLESEGLSQGLFYAVHLRGENDWPADWGTRDDQIRLYLEDIHATQAKGPEITAVYVSSGDLGVIDLMRSHPLAEGLNIVDKLGLLSNQPDILHRLEQLGFDSRAIVEYSVLVAADYFIGLTASTLSDLVAYARTVDDDIDFYNTYIVEDSVPLDHVFRYWEQPDGPVLRGNEHTKLLTCTGPYVMDAFP